MNAHMQINSPVLREQAMLARERRERLWPRSTISRPLARMLYVEFDAHVQRRAEVLRWQTALYEDACSHVNAWRDANFPGSPTTRRVIEHAAARFGTTRAEILGPRKGHTIVRARQIAVYVVHWTSNHSLSQIGGRFGGRDHTTIWHAIHAIGERAQVDTSLREDIEAICAAAGLSWREGAPHAGA